MILLFIFFLVFIFAIDFIQIANIIFLIIYTKQVLKNKGKIQFSGKLSTRFLFFLYITWITLTTVIYSLITNTIDTRNLTQYFFNFQYIILIIGFNYNIKFFEKWVLNFSVLITFLFISLIYYYNIPFAALRDSEMLISVIPGYPNTLAIPLLFALWLAFKQNKTIWLKFFLIIGLIFTGSRGGLLGIIFIVLYFLIKNNSKSKYFLLFFSILLISLFSILANFLLQNDLILTQLTRSYDREDIFRTTMAYFTKNPIFGYGGNTIGQLQDIKINYSPSIIWDHTHNWVFEILIRYGLVGLVLFLAFIISIIKNISDFDKKYIFIIFLILALFQNFIRDFVFIFFLSYLANSSNDIRIIKNGDKS